MAKMMKAAVVRAFGEPLTIEEVPIPTPRPGKVLVEVVASGVCHTDLHAADGDWPVKPKLPFVPGHEGAGVVAAVGPGVTSSKKETLPAFRGYTTRAARASTASPAGETLCEAQHESGYRVDGALSPST